MSEFVKKLHTLAHTDLTKTVEEYATEHFVPVMRAESSAVLQQIVRIARPKRILEIGTAIGYSGILMLEASDRAHLTTIEYNESRVLEAKQNFAEAGMSHRVTQFTGDVKEILPFVSGQFDFVFMDGPKGHYGEFVDILRPHLVDGAVVVCDNVLFRGYLDDPSSCPRRMKTITANMTEFLIDMTKSEDFDTVVVENGDGLSISVYKRVNK